MAKVYLKAGQPISFWAYFRVGATGTVADLQPDWTKTLKSGAGELTGAFVDSERFTFDVYIEEHSGRFWYDDEKGY